MVVATVSADGQPSSRMVLLKGVDERGFVFFTNLGSRKGQELLAEARCALLFPWHPLERQVRVEGWPRWSRERGRRVVLSRPARGIRGWALGRRINRGRWQAEKNWPRRTPPRRPVIPMRCRCQRSGVGSASRPTRSSSGRVVRVGCMTAWCIAEITPAGRLYVSRLK